MSVESIALCISNDFLGAAGRADRHVAQFQRVLPAQDINVRDIEVVGVGSVRTVRNRIAAFEAANYKVKHVHGSTGFSEKDTLWNKMKTRVIAPFMPGIQELAQGLPEYGLLVHAPTAHGIRTEADFRLLHSRSFLIENHDSGISGVVSAMNQAQRLARQPDIHAKVLVDMCHFIGSQFLNGPEFFSRWNTMVSYLQHMTASQHGLISALHWPIGTDRLDSLPMHRITDGMLETLIASLGPSIKLIGFEYQRHPLGLIYLDRKEEATVRNRMKQIFGRIRKAGLQQL